MIHAAMLPWLDTTGQGAVRALADWWQRVMRESAQDLRPEEVKARVIGIGVWLGADYAKGRALEAHGVQVRVVLEAESIREAAHLYYCVALLAEALRRGTSTDQLHHELHELPVDQRQWAREAARTLSEIEVDIGRLLEQQKRQSPYAYAALQQMVSRQTGLSFDVLAAPEGMMRLQAESVLVNGPTLQVVIGYLSGRCRSSSEALAAVLDTRLVQGRDLAMYLISQLMTSTL